MDGQAWLNTQAASERGSPATMFRVPVSHLRWRSAARSRGRHRLSKNTLWPLIVRWWTGWSMVRGGEAPLVLAEDWNSARRAASVLARVWCGIELTGQGPWEQCGRWQAHPYKAAVVTRLSGPYQTRDQIRGSHPTMTRWPRGSFIPCLLRFILVCLAGLFSFHDRSLRRSSMLRFLWTGTLACGLR